MTKLLLVISAVTLTGCGTIFENRVVCTVDGKDAYFISKYANVSVGAQIAKADAEVICTIAVIKGVTSTPPKAPQKLTGDEA